MFYRLSEQYRYFVRDLIVNLQALSIVMERRGYLVSCYTCGEEADSACFMVSMGNEMIRFLVSDQGIVWTEICDDAELVRLEGAEAIARLQELADLIKQGLMEPAQPLSAPLSSL
ncbi:MAG: DUF1815 family protein [Aphanocapsa lilacina HA4352-LM1]|uniref:DUF1815 family protein n=1 Tax=Gloeobacter morelensis MG652769 TaxID=2781736 RepID=A0ABY3PKQ8_9CYAN|nr:DUF1815 family protein [Gloeobacter morelensis]MBW4699084.1 DUF1815 family protein [Aphanocapsa lilacina HA4352-LM1]UFP94228.1 DUF1815 family protein [Gloeobacter morelensis MG652769]